MDADTAKTTTRQAPIGWYVHVPFCRRKCGYCDFYSVPTVPALVDGLIHAVRKELALRNPGRPVDAIFVGGGTPTALPHAALRSVLEALSAAAGTVAEFTVEANPSTAAETALHLLRETGANRLSLGAQSFNDDELTTLERTHASRQIGESFAAARAAGFDNVNLDLIFAIPGQTVDSWRDTLRHALDLGPEHLSCYGLTYEPGTPLTDLRDQGRIAACGETLEAELFETTLDILPAAGYEHYEISNFAKPGMRCRANLIYWENREYLGLGPSAVSYLDGVRRRNVPDVEAYVRLMASDPARIVVEAETLDPLRRACETAIQMLRMTDGIDLARFLRQTGHDARRLFAEPIARFTRLGLMHATPRTVRLTRQGIMVANRILSDLLPDEVECTTLHRDTDSRAAP